MLVLWQETAIACDVVVFVSTGQEGRLAIGIYVTYDI